jgi:hypothetical protein
VREAKPLRSKSKGKGKSNFDDEVKEEVRVERLRKVNTEIAVLQDIVDQLESEVFIVLSSTSFPTSVPVFLLYLWFF